MTAINSNRWKEYAWHLQFVLSAMSYVLFTFVVTQQPSLSHWLLSYYSSKEEVTS